MKPLSQHIQESLNEESKNILDIATRNDGKELGLPESNSEETIEDVANEDAKNEDEVTEEATEKEKPSE